MLLLIDYSLDLKAVKQINELMVQIKINQRNLIVCYQNLNSRQKMNSKAMLCEKCRSQILSDNFAAHKAMCRGPITGDKVMARVIEDPSKSRDGSQSNHDISRQIQKALIQRPSKGLFDQPPKLIVPNQRVSSASIANSIAQQPVIPSEKPAVSKPKPTKNQRKKKVVEMDSESDQPILPKKQKPKKQQPKKQQPRQYIYRQRQPEVESERFPCPDCGYRMTMGELDTHPNLCEVKKRRCEYCSLIFPIDLMTDHHAVCTHKLRGETNTERNNRTEEILRIARQHIRETLQQNNLGSQTHSTGLQSLERRPTSTFIPGRSQQANSRSENEPRPAMSSNPFQSLLTMFTGIPTSGEYDLELSAYYHREPRAFHRPMSQSFERTVTTLAENTNPKKIEPLQTNKVKKLPIVTFDRFKKEHYNCNNCSICVTEFIHGDQLIQLPCGHLFNQQCIVTWLKKSPFCPNCRRQIEIETIPSNSKKWNPRIVSEPSSQGGNNPFRRHGVQVVSAPNPSPISGISSPFEASRPNTQNYVRPRPENPFARYELPAPRTTETSQESIPRTVPTRTHFNPNNQRQ